MHKTGFMGLLGPKVDSIDYWRAKSQEMNPQLEAEQRHTLQEMQQAAAFVIFSDRRSAAEASQVRCYECLSTLHNVQMPFVSH